MHLLIVLLAYKKMGMFKATKRKKKKKSQMPLLQVPLSYTVWLIRSCLHKLYIVEKATYNHTGQASISI